MSIAPAGVTKSKTTSWRTGICYADWQHWLQSSKYGLYRNFEFQLFRYVLEVVSQSLPYLKKELKSKTILMDWPRQRCHPLAKWALQSLISLKESKPFFVLQIFCRAKQIRYPKTHFKIRSAMSGFGIPPKVGGLSIAIFY
jgi:hypothetical protein